MFSITFTDTSQQILYKTYSNPGITGKGYNPKYTAT